MLRTATEYDERYSQHPFWTDGRKVYYRHYEIKGADKDTFEVLWGLYARDKKHCYFQSNRLAGADCESFVVLNPTYAKDKTMVWGFGSRIKEADAASFEACDAGAQPLSIRKDAIEPYMEITEKGYGKDAHNVYYMGFWGKPTVVKNADPATFVSFGDNYAKDAQRVFYEKYSLPKASPTTWDYIDKGFYYTRDGNRIYYMNRLMKGVDVETFELLFDDGIRENGHYFQYARDKNTYYDRGEPITKEACEKRGELPEGYE